MQKFDCIVVGGGMVGAASALSLAKLGLTVALIEKFQPNTFSSEQAFDLRVSAISLASQQLLTELNTWPQISRWRCCPYSRLSVWEQQETAFNAKDINQTHLGHIVENRLIQLALWQQIELMENIELFCPQEVISFEQTNESINVELTDRQLNARLLIAADGAQSKIRQLAKIGVTGWQYGQSAMLMNVNTQLAQQDITWQQYQSTGPVAMLPMPGRNASLVWYHQKDVIARLSKLSNEQLTQEVSITFPQRLGEVSVNNKAAFPLTRQHANSYQNHRVLLVGDAAHTINPMAGQGVNLGFKDVVALSSVISDLIRQGEDWSCPEMLKRYEQLRRRDNLLMMSAMDALYAGFSHPAGIVKAARNAVLKATHNLPLIKNKVLSYACGL